MSFHGTESEILDRLCALAADQVSIDPSTVAADSDFFTDLNFDSLDAVEFVMKIEDEFHVTIDDQQSQSVHTPRQAYVLLAAVFSPQGAAQNGR